MASEFATPVAARDVAAAVGARCLRALPQPGAAAAAGAAAWQLVPQPDEAALAQDAFRGVAADTRALQPGYLFAALRGARRDGHEFLLQAREAGAAAALVAESWARQLVARGGSRRSDSPAAARGLALLAVPDPLTALGNLAAWHRARHPVCLVAVTGSNGKTTAKEIIAGVLGRRLETLRTAGNFNNLLGVPLMALRLSRRHAAAVLELAMNHAGEMGRLADIVRPDVAVFTNVGPAHLGHLGSLAAIAEAKAELLGGLREGGVVIMNADDEQVCRVVERWAAGSAVAPASRRVVAYGVARGEVRATSIAELGLGGVRFTLELAGRTAPVHLRCLGRHTVHHALAAAAVGREFGLGLPDIVAGLEAFEGLPQHLEPLRLGNGVVLINDAYNANPASMTAALRFLASLPRSGRAWLVAGDMLELGEAAEALHGEIGARCAEAALECLIAVGDFAAAVVAGARRGGMPASACHAAATLDEAATELETRLQAGDVVLCKASRGMRLELLCERLVEWAGGHAAQVCERRPGRKA